MRARELSDEEISQAVFSPQERVALAVRLIDEQRKNSGSGLRTGFSDLDRVMTPMRAGDLIIVCGATSNFKSRFMDLVAINVTGQIDEENDVVIKCTWEQSVEEDEIPGLSQEAGIGFGKSVFGRVNDNEFESVLRSATKKGVAPLWTVGHSILRENEIAQSRPQLNIDEVARSIRYIRDRATDYKRNIRLIVLDYLQRINLDGEYGDSMRERFIKVVDKAKNMAIEFKCPVILGSQARRDVLERKIGLPLVSDGLETSNIEHSADKFISVWLPIKSVGVYHDGGPLTLNGEEYTVNPNLLIVGLMKQKLGMAPATFAYHVDYEKYSVKSLNGL